MNRAEEYIRSIYDNIARSRTLPPYAEWREEIQRLADAQQVRALGRRS